MESNTISEKSLMEQYDSKDVETMEAVRFQRCSDLYGRPAAVEIAKMGKRRTPRFPIPISDPEEYSDLENPVYSKRKAKILRGLNAEEQTVFLMIHEDGCSIADVAKHFKVSRQAIYSRLKQMVRKSKYCRISAEFGRLRRKVNQHC
jgi:Sigma-70, region 4